MFPKKSFWTRKSHAFGWKQHKMKEVIVLNHSTKTACPGKLWDPFENKY